LILRGLPYFNWSPTFRNMERVFIDCNCETLSVLKSECSFKVGNGRTIYFWTDKWLQSGILRDKFPGLYALSAAPAYCLAPDMGEYVKETWHWKLNRKRSFIKAIRTLIVNNSYNCSMRLVWVQMKRISESPGKNTVGSNWISWSIYINASIASSKVEMFLWLLLQDRDSTREFLVEEIQSIGAN